MATTVQQRLLRGCRSDRRVGGADIHQLGNQRDRHGVPPHGHSSRHAYGLTRGRCRRARWYSSRD